MMDNATPEAFFSQHGTSETFGPGISAETPDQPEKPARPPIEPKLVFPSSLRGVAIPEMQWIVDGWIPVGDVTLLYGDGGVGKTLLAQQLMACAAIGAPWCSLPVRRCKSLGIFCEDDDAELHRRQAAIQRHLGVEFGDPRMDNMCWWSRKGESNLLGTFDHEGVIRIAPLYDAILTAAKGMGARLVILDTAADLFGGNENDRGQVRQFIGALSRLAMDIRGAVVLNAHPSRAGMSAGGAGDGGSTGWSNSARSRLSLERPKADGDEPGDTNARILAKRKSNRSSIGETIRLAWRDGVIAPSGGEMPMSATAERADADATFLSLLARCGGQGLYVSASKNAGNFAGKVFAARPDRCGFTARDFESAMHRLFAAGAIRVEDYRAANRLMRQRISLSSAPIAEDAAP